MKENLTIDCFCAEEKRRFSIFAQGLTIFNDAEYDFCIKCVHLQIIYEHYFMV
jgi:hypothetical protein